MLDAYLEDCHRVVADHVAAAKGLGEKEKDEEGHRLEDAALHQEAGLAPHPRGETEVGVAGVEHQLLDRAARWHAAAYSSTSEIFGNIHQWQKYLEITSTEEIFGNIHQGQKYLEIFIKGRNIWNCARLSYF